MPTHAGEPAVTVIRLAAPERRTDAAARREVLLHPVERARGPAGESLVDDAGPPGNGWVTGHPDGLAEDVVGDQAPALNTYESPDPPWCRHTGEVHYQALRGHTATVKLNP